MTAAELRPWLVWATGLLACVVVVLDSTTFGVSGLDAADRFGARPGLLSSFMVLPIIAFGGGQIPAGVLLDRFGPRATVATGVAVATLGQLTLGLTHSLPIAIGAYAAIGLGGAPAFISVIRLLPAWFAPARIPLLTQLTGICATLGQLLSAVPFLAILQRNGWTTAYLCTAAVGAVSVVLTLSLICDAPQEARGISTTRTLRATLGDVKVVWSNLGTRLGFFTLMGTNFSVSVFTLMWGVPYLTTTQGMSRSAAGALLTIPVAVFAVAGVPVGIVSGRYPRRRPALVLAMIGASALAWTAVLVLPVRAPLWLLVVLVVVISLGEPFAYIAFDFARAFNSPATLGTAQGIVNTGASVAALLVIQAMGITIDVAGGYSFNAFRMAWATQYVMWALAAAGVVITARKAHAASAPSAT